MLSTLVLDCLHRKRMVLGRKLFFMSIKRKRKPKKGKKKEKKERERIYNLPLLSLVYIDPTDVEACSDAFRVSFCCKVEIQQMKLI